MSIAYKAPIVRLSYVMDCADDRPKMFKSSTSAKVFFDTYDPGDIGYREEFKVAYLSRSLTLLGINTVSMGGTSSAIVDIKIIMQGALLANADSIIVCHNHPSGNLKPSTYDNDVTKKISAACKLLEINMLDHIIITPSGSYYSYLDEGML